MRRSERRPGGREVFYDFALTAWLEITPDLQCIRAGLPGVDDALVIGTRLQMYFWMRWRRPGTHARRAVDWILASTSGRR